jgi:hypothetical protein
MALCVHFFLVADRAASPPLLLWSPARPKAEAAESPGRGVDTPLSFRELAKASRLADGLHCWWCGPREQHRPWRVSGRDSLALDDLLEVDLLGTLALWASEIRVQLGEDLVAVGDDRTKRAQPRER